MLLIPMNGIGSSSLSLPYTKIFTYSIWQQKSLLQNVIYCFDSLQTNNLPNTDICTHFDDHAWRKIKNDLSRIYFNCIWKSVPHCILYTLDVIDIGFSLAFIPSLLAAFDIGNNFRVSSAATSCSIIAWIPDRLPPSNFSVGGRARWQ